MCLTTAPPPGHTDKLNTDSNKQTSKLGVSCVLRYQKVAVSEVSGITVVDGIPVMEGKVRVSCPPGLLQS